MLHFVFYCCMCLVFFRLFNDVAAGVRFVRICVTHIINIFAVKLNLTWRPDLATPDTERSLEVEVLDAVLTFLLAELALFAVLYRKWMRHMLKLQVLTVLLMPLVLLLAYAT